jgi:subtilisin family serine protease
MAGLSVEARGFAAGGYRSAPHGLAVASLLAGGAKGTVFSADVYGAGPTGGSAEAVVRALAWLAQSRTSVINVSLVGPPNRALEAATKALVGRGVLLVAAVGNDGPAAPPAYPASYPGVLAVTGVDRRGKPLIEAGRALHVDFAAPGADIAAAQPNGWGSVRGTSFAAPIVAGRLAVLQEAAADNPLEALARQARDLGPKGPDKTFGRGLVGGELFSR